MWLSSGAGAARVRCRSGAASPRPAPFQTATTSNCTGRLQHAFARVAAGKRSFGEKLSAELLDVVTGGPKMRKWYGQESNQVPKDGGAEEAPQQEAPQQQPDAAQRQQQQQAQQQAAYSGPQDVVLVTDADTPTGELVTLQLILRRENVRVLVRDTAAAKTGYGPYVDPVSVDINSAGGLARALRGVKTVIAVGKLGALLPAAQQAGVQRLVLLSTAGMPQRGGLAALFQGGADACLRDVAREAAVAASAIPHVIVKAGLIDDVPGGASKLAITPSRASGSSSGGGSGGGGSVSREDLATALVAGAVHLPEFGSSSSSSGDPAQLVFAVQAAGPGAPPDSWEQLLEGVAAAAA